MWGVFMMSENVRAAISSCSLLAICRLFRVLGQPLHFPPALFDFVVKEMKKHIVLILNKVQRKVGHMQLHTHIQLHTQLHTNRHRQTQTHTDTHRHTYSYTHTHRHRQTHIQLHT